MLTHALVTDDWVQALMKGAANCAEHCEMHTFVSKWLPERVSACCICAGQGCFMVVSGCAHVYVCVHVMVRQGLSMHCNVTDAPYA